ncbi:MAG: hypothetical protein P1V81_07080 [Planctomycetota bacterium]|nr:hypothetical protein [Planctomycetota bacterium]
MERIGPDDPLELARRCSERIEQRALLMDAERLQVRACAYVATIAVRDEYRGVPPLEQFLQTQIDEAIDSVLDEDWGSEYKNEPLDPDDYRYRMLSAEAGLEPAQLRRVSLAFNTAPTRTRRVLFGVLIQNRPLVEVARENALGLKESKAMVREGLDKIFGARDWRFGK